MPEQTFEDWNRLGKAVRRARKRANTGGLAEMKRWAPRIGRSPRLLQGLERGEPVGRDTKERIEAALGWPEGRCDEILSGADLITGPDGSLLFVPARQPISGTTNSTLELAENGTSGAAAIATEGSHQVGISDTDSLLRAIRLIEEAHDQLAQLLDPDFTTAADRHAQWQRAAQQQLEEGASRGATQQGVERGA